MKVKRTFIFHVIDRFGCPKQTKIPNNTALNVKHSARQSAQRSTTTTSSNSMTTLEQQISHQKYLYTTPLNLRNNNGNGNDDDSASDTVEVENNETMQSVAASDDEKRNVDNVAQQSKPKRFQVNMLVCFVCVVLTTAFIVSCRRCFHKSLHCRNLCHKIRIVCIFLST
jgi:hypothetical protein